MTPLARVGCAAVTELGTYLDSENLAGGHSAQNHRRQCLRAALELNYPTRGADHQEATAMDRRRPPRARQDVDDPGPHVSRGRVHNQVVDLLDKAVNGNSGPL